METISTAAASLGLVALVALPALPLIYKGPRDRDWHLIVERRNTQSRRYALVMIGQAIIIPVLAWLVAENSVSEIANAISWCFTRGLAGYLVAILSLLAFASPVITAIALLIILRAPVEMAHKGPTKNSYCPTLYHRAGECKFIRIDVTIDPETGQGVQHRTEL